MSTYSKKISLEIALFHSYHMVQGSYIWDFKYSDRQPRNMPQMQGKALEISLDFQLGPIPAILFLHTPLELHLLDIFRSF